LLEAAYSGSFNQVVAFALRVISIMQCGDMANCFIMGAIYAV